MRSRPRRRWVAHSLGVALAAVVVACATPVEDPGLHWLFAVGGAYQNGNCDRVRELAAEAERRLPDQRSRARLLAAHCDELDGEYTRARAAYEAVARAAPGSDAGIAARARLEELARMDEGFAREAVLDRAREAAAIPPQQVPVPVTRAPVRYPGWLLSAEMQGWVRVALQLDAEGAPRNVVVEDSWPPFVFEPAALRAVRGSRYSPPAETDFSRTWLVLFEFRLAD